jgi:hypothetical protein
MSAPPPALLYLYFIIFTIFRLPAADEKMRLADVLILFVCIFHLS